MSSIKKPDLYSFQERARVAIIFVGICFGLLAIRLFWLQIISHQQYSTLADSNRIAIVPVPANRGLLIDRNGIVIGRNYSALTLEVDASQINGNETISSMSFRRLFKLALEIAETLNVPSKILETWVHFLCVPC